jgi:hypothetical protein
MEMDYREGAPVPPGYRVEEKIRKGLVIGGAVTFGSLYVVNAIIASIAIDADSNNDEWAVLYIPIGGPFAAIATLDAQESGAAILIIDGLGQAGGLAMLIAGAAAKQKKLVYTGEGLTLNASPTPGGMALSGTFEAL